MGTLERKVEAMMREPGNMGLRGEMAVKPWTRWQNWANVVLGIILFIAPWFIGTAYNLRIPADSHAAWNAWIVGAVVALVALWSLAAPRASLPEWINVVLGVWLFIAPWVLGYSFLAAPAWTAWIIGILVIIMAGWAIMDVMRLYSAPTV
jgi:hypothetical protein